MRRIDSKSTKIECMYKSWGTTNKQKKIMRFLGKNTLCS